MSAGTTLIQSSPIDNPLLRVHMPELDSVRGLAVLLVLFYHGMAPPLHAELSSWGKLLFSVSQYGWIGVNLFFVLSGFLITGILVDSRDGPGALRRFYIRRALRILPALYVMLLVLLIGGWIGWRFATLGALFLANCAPLLGVAIQYGPLWSLAVEEHFYLIWPWMVRRLPDRGLMLLLALVVVGTSGLRVIVFALHGPRADFVPLYTWFNLDGLALGALLALWLRQSWFCRRMLSFVAPVIFVGGGAAFVLLLGLPRWGTALSPGALSLACAGLVGCVLLAGTTRWRGWVTQAPLIFFGHISYGLYLVHVLAFRVAETMVARPLARVAASGSPTASMVLRFAAGATLATGLAFLSRSSLEEFFLRMESGMRDKRDARGTDAARSSSASER